MKHNSYCIYIYITQFYYITATTVTTAAAAADDDDAVYLIYYLFVTGRQYNTTKEKAVSI